MQSKYPVGVCNQMCPDEEIIRRKRDRLLHVLETSSDVDSLQSVPDPDRIVKEFSRSAAGRRTQNVKNLRTPDALLKTIDYLLNDIMIRKDVPWNVVYDFISDRLRAVRQDMVIQNLSRSICISLLQPMIKFYVYSAYRLCEEPIGVFDPHINNTHLQECLKRLLCIYDEMDILVLKINQNKPDIKYNNILYSECRPFMESLYLILNMGNTTAMNRTLNLPDMWKTPLVRKCFKLCINCWQKNYIRVCREINTLPPLLLSCAFLHLPYIRKSLLAIMSVAYSCKNMSFPLDTLQEILLYNNEEEVLNECAYYGIEVKNSNIIFSKSTFNGQKSQLPSKHSKFIDDQLSVYNLSRLLLEDD